MQLNGFPLPLRIPAAALSVYAAVTLLWLRPQLDAAQAQTAALSANCDALAQSSAALKTLCGELDADGDADRALAALARAKLNLVLPDEIVFRATGS